MLGLVRRGGLVFGLVFDFVNGRGFMRLMLHRMLAPPT
jgi:hypothetical protein